MKTSIAVAGLLSLFIVAPVLAHETSYIDTRSGYNLAQNTRDNYGYIRQYLEGRVGLLNERLDERAGGHEQYHDERAALHKQYHNERSARAKENKHARRHEAHTTVHAQRCRQHEYRSLNHRACSVHRPQPHNSQHQAFAPWLTDSQRYRH